MLTFRRIYEGGEDSVSLEPSMLVIGGWAGRDEAALRHHAEELAAIGVPLPSSMPVFYRVGVGQLTQAGRLEVLGTDSSGEVEPVIVALDDGFWLTVGSDHTDRKAETFGIALSKQLCGKVVARTLWRLDEVAGRWDSLVMRAHAVIDGERVLYQEGTLAGLRTPADMMARCPTPLMRDGLMFCGTLGAIGGIRPAERFEMELFDPATGRSISHGYDVAPLPVVA